MPAFLNRLLRHAPEVIVRAANGAVAILGVLLVLVALFNRQLAEELSDWEGFSPWWALLPFALLVVYGLLRAAYDEVAAAEKARDEALRKPAESASAVFDIGGELRDSTFEDVDVQGGWGGGFTKTGGDVSDSEFKGLRYRGAPQPEEEEEEEEP